jgi:hypothetical protein
VRHFAVLATEGRYGAHAAREFTDLAEACIVQPLDRIVDIEAVVGACALFDGSVDEREPILKVRSEAGEAIFPGPDFGGPTKNYRKSTSRRAKQRRPGKNARSADGSTWQDRP